MFGRMDAQWTIGELADRVAAVLVGAARDGHAPPASGRIRDVPDVRAIRWYSTIGILDKPDAYRGRTALYGPRHLMQLVAVKRRQGEGAPLAQIQSELVGASDARLAEIADLPSGVRLFGPATSSEDGRHDGPSTSNVTVRDRDVPSGSTDTRFWTRRDPVVSVDGVGSRPVVASYGIEMAPGVTIHIAADRPPDSADITAIQEVAPQLLRVLRARGLHRTGADR